MSSVSQDSWQEIMETVRIQLAKQVPLMPAMKVEEQKTFIEAINLARYEEQSAAIYDAELDKKRTQAGMVFSE